MPIRFSTEAANADFVGDVADNNMVPEGTPNAAGVDRKPKPKVDDDAKSGEAKPGKDINAAGFIKDKDSPKP